YTILFRAPPDTLRTIAADPNHLGAEIGFFAVLHTWGQTLVHHPHLHCVVPAGGLSPDGTRWVPCRPGFFLPVRVLSRLFRRLFLAGLVDAHAAGRLAFFDQLEGLRRREAFAAHLAPLRRKKWFLYAKPPPCADPEPVPDPLVERDEADPAAGAAADHRPPCPCCGGRMIIVGTFERAAVPRAPPSPDTGVRTAMP